MAVAIAVRDPAEEIDQLFDHRRIDCAQFLLPACR
jgi:hypothetical protein